MSLRWRFALIFAGGTIVATIVVAAVAVWTTGRSLEAEIDDTLFGRIESERFAVPDLPGTETIRIRAFSESAAGPFGGRRPPIFPGLDSLIQVNRPDGSVALILEESPELPFYVPDRSGPVFRTIEANGTPYRVGAVVGEAGDVLQLARDLTETEAVLTELRRRIVFFGLIFAAVAGLIGWLAARRVVTPVEELTGAAEEIAKTRDLSMSIASGGDDEVGRLGASFNTMLEALRTSRAQQRRLVQDASHELRTPLTSLRTNIDVLRRAGDLAAADREAILTDIDSEVRELSDLVTELVELATDVERTDEPLREVDLGDLVSGVIERARRRTGRTITVNTTASTVSVWPSMIERAVSNLIDNAHKWSPGETTIVVSVDGTRLSVLDHGPGIAESDLPKIFDRFYRSDQARSSPGSGLGLAIVKQLVEAHGGRVFASNRPGGGAEVGFELPPR